jgi:hypothetical protein
VQFKFMESGNAFGIVRELETSYVQCANSGIHR